MYNTRHPPYFSFYSVHAQLDVIDNPPSHLRLLNMNGGMSDTICPLLRHIRTLDRGACKKYEFIQSPEPTPSAIPPRAVSAKDSSDAGCSFGLDMKPAKPPCFGILPGPE